MLTSLVNRLPKVFDAVEALLDSCRSTCDDDGSSFSKKIGDEIWWRDQLGCDVSVCGFCWPWEADHQVSKGDLWVMSREYPTISTATLRVRVNGIVRDFSVRDNTALFDEVVGLSKRIIAGDQQGVPDNVIGDRFVKLKVHTDPRSGSRQSHVTIHYNDWFRRSK